jgi:hypothetical protein
MLKKTLDKKYLQRVVNTTQRIEGYSEASKKVKDEAKMLREKYGIKISF